MAIGDSYIDWSELADYLKMTVTGNEPELEVAASAASSWVEDYCRRQFNLAATATARYFDVFQSGAVPTDDIGSDTGLLVASDDQRDGTFATSWAAGDFQTGPSGAVDLLQPITVIHPAGSLRFPLATQRTGLVRVTARWGWPQVPREVHLATLIQAARFYKRRESAEGVLGFSQFGTVRVGSIVDPDVAALLDPLRYAAAVV